MATRLGWAEVPDEIWLVARTDYTWVAGVYKTEEAARKQWKHLLETGRCKLIRYSRAQDH